MDVFLLTREQFQEDAWVRPNGGGGISRVMAGGKVFEKAGVNLSVVYGTMPQEVNEAHFPKTNILYIRTYVGSQSARPCRRR